MTTTPGARFLACKYALTAEEANALARHPQGREIERIAEEWRAENGCPAPNSPAGKGFLLELLAERS